MSYINDVQRPFGDAAEYLSIDDEETFCEVAVAACAFLSYNMDGTRFEFGFYDPASRQFYISGEDTRFLLAEDIALEALEIKSMRLFAEIVEEEMNGGVPVLFSSTRRWPMFWKERVVAFTPLPEDFSVSLTYGTRNYDGLIEYCDYWDPDED